MKHYNIQNYIRYKEDLKSTLNRLPDKLWGEYTRDELVIKFMPLVENLARMRLPEHVTNEIRKNFGKDKKAVALFFNSIFLSIDAGSRDDDDMFLQIEDTSEPYNQVFLNMYLTSLLKQHLTDKEYHVLRLSYGLDCEKHSAKEIAKFLEIEGTGAYVRVSQLKKQAVDKLIENVDHSQVFDYL